MRFEDIDNPHITRVPKHPTPRALFLYDVYHEQLIEKENYYLPDERSKNVKMDGCDMPMYIFGEGDKDPNSQENARRDNQTKKGG